MTIAQVGGAAMRRIVGGDPVERTAAMVSTTSVGTTFGPGLLPRGGTDQAIATGLVSAIQYGMVVTSQSMFAGIAKAIVGDDGSARKQVQRHLVQAGVTGVVAAAGFAVERLLPVRRGEPLRRAVVRTTGRRMARVGAAGVVIAAVTAADEATGQGRPGLRALTFGGSVAAGAALAGWQIHTYRSEGLDELPPAVDPLALQTEPEPETIPERAPMPPLARSLAVGVAVSAGLHILAVAESAVAGVIGSGVLKVAPGSRHLARAGGHAVALGALGAGCVAGIEYINRKAELGGAAIDAAYTTPPSSRTVSGGPASVVQWSTLSREGVRLVNMALTPKEISDVTGTPLDTVASPVRAFAGLASGPTIDARVDLVMDELERLGAFERSVICVASPTGSGYVNYVAIETMEYLTRGDCATVALQYSLRPSFLSLDRVAMGRDQNRALFHALSGRLRGIPQEQRPRLVGFGESLGAHTMQDAFLYEGASGFHRAGIDRALFLGTPAGSKWATQWRLAPERTDPDSEVVEVPSYQAWLALDQKDRDRHRFVLLSHPEDPIPKFAPELLVQEPEWLGPQDTRPAGVPPHAHWYPITTFFLTLVDTKNAMTVVPGTFVARGHDYRADLARMVSVAYDLPVSDEELGSIERALRERERVWAERRLVAEQVEQAKEAVRRQMSSWGLTPSEAVPAV
jgi:uncharacterized membrane protein